jgi:hypothetical protein
MPRDQSDEHAARALDVTTSTSAVALLDGRTLSKEQEKQLKALVAAWDRAPSAKDARARLSDARVTKALSGPLPSILYDATRQNGGAPGYYVRAAVNGSASHYLRYVSKAVRESTREGEAEAKPLAGRTVRHLLGRWPEVSVAQARHKAREIMARVHLGEDPQHERISERAAAKDFRLSETMQLIGARLLPRQRDDDKDKPKPLSSYHKAVKRDLDNIMRVIGRRGPSRSRSTTR